MNVQDIENALRAVRYPGFKRDIVSVGAVRELSVEGGAVRFAIAVDDPAVVAQIEPAARDAVLALDGVVSVEIAKPAAAGGAPALGMAPQRPSAAAGGAVDSALLPQVKAVIAVASGKGGVGKSTVAVNLAIALARNGASVGLLDADIYGPSIPLMMGRRDAQPTLDQKQGKMLPFERFGVRFMSLGFLVPPDSAVVWRGPMVMKALIELLGNVAWGALDVLVVDMPPGTGDAQLTLSQKVRLAGAVIVTTPQDVALADAIKGVAMFRKVDVPVLGIVENMSYFLCPHCSGRTEIFGHGGGRAQAERLGVPFLGEIALDAAIRSAGDEGQPIVAAAPDSTQAAGFARIAASLGERLDADAAPGRGGNIFERFRKAWDGSPGS